jgi:flagellar hook-associated protein 2
MGGAKGLVGPCTMNWMAKPVQLITLTIAVLFHNSGMTTYSTTALGLGSGTGLSDLYTRATSSLLSQNQGIKAIDAQLRRDDARLSSLGKMALALDGFRTTANKLSAAGLDLSASSSGKGVGATLSGSSAVAGSHTVEVKQLAQAQELASKALSARDAALGTGAATVIKIESGSGSNATTTTVRIGAANNTLDGIAKAMRDAGLDAEVVQDGKGYALNLTGKSGAANGMRISVSGDAALQGLLSYGPGTNSAMTQKTAAQDAQLVVDGKSITSSGNQVDSAIAGVSLTLSATGKSDVKVARDSSAIAANVKSLVGAFNDMNGTLAALRTGDSGSDTALNQVMNQLAQAIDGADRKTLSDLGITRKNGTLVLDEKKLNAAIAADPQRVSGFFTNAGKGLAEQLAQRAGQQIAEGGAVANQAHVVQDDVDKLTDKKAKITDTVNRQAAMLVQQYSLAGAGGSSLFGNGQVKPMSLFDFLA